MANNVTYIIELVDKFSKMAKEIEHSVRGLDGAISNSSKRVETFRSRMLNAVGPISLRAFKNFGRNLSLYVSAPLGLAMVSMLRAHQKLETLQSGFSGMLHSSVKSKAFVESLKEFGRESPFELKNILEAATQFTSARMSPKESLKTLKIIGDLSAMTGASINTLSPILANIKNQRRLYRMDLRSLLYHGVNLNAVFLKHLSISSHGGKVTLKELLKLESQGSVTYEMVMKALNTMVSKGGIAFNQMKIHMGTMLGAFKQLKDNTFQLEAALGGILDKQLHVTRGMQILTEHIKVWIKELPDAEKHHKLLTKVLSKLLVALLVLGPGIKAVTASWKLLVFVFKPSIAIIRAVSAALVGLGMSARVLLLMSGWGALIAAALFGIYEIFKHWDAILLKIKSTWHSLVQVMKHPIVTLHKIVTKLEEPKNLPSIMDIADLTSGINVKHTPIKEMPTIIKDMSTLVLGTPSLKLTSPIERSPTSVSKSHITLNVNDKNDTIKSIHSEHTGDVHFNVGRNMAHA